jgi:hypothetical protein
MPKKVQELSALEVRRREAPGMHFVGGVPGLALQILPTGGRTWILRVVIAGRRRDMGLGGFPEVGLAQARAKAAELRDQIRSGRDPLAEVRAARSALRAAAESSMTFKQAADKFIEAHRPSWSNPKHADQWVKCAPKQPAAFVVGWKKFWIGPRAEACAVGTIRQHGAAT